MATGIDSNYRTEKLLDWERKSLNGKFSGFSLSDKDTWMSLGLIILLLSVFSIIIPFIPPRYGWSTWTPATTSEEYWYRIMHFCIVASISTPVIFACITIRNKIDLSSGIKRIANFQVTDVFDLGVIKILIMNGWRPFAIKAVQPYFVIASRGQIITIKRTATFRLIDYYVRDEKRFNDEIVARQ